MSTKHYFCCNCVSIKTTTTVIITNNNNVFLLFSLGNCLMNIKCSHFMQTNLHAHQQILRPIT